MLALLNGTHLKVALWLDQNTMLMADFDKIAKSAENPNCKLIGERKLQDENIGLLNGMYGSEHRIGVYH